MAKEIFISYSRKDFDKVKAIKDEIDRELGIKCWMDLDGIESGEEFETKIIDAINSHRFFLFMLSPNSMASEYALDELNFAHTKGKHIDFVNVTKCQMTDRFLFKYKKYDAIDWSDPLQHDKLLNNFRKRLSNKPTQTSISESYSVRFSTDETCELYIDGEKKRKLKGGHQSIVEGFETKKTYRISFRSLARTNSVIYVDYIQTSLTVPNQVFDLNISFAEQRQKEEEEEIAKRQAAKLEKEKEREREGVVLQVLQEYDEFSNLFCGFYIVRKGCLYGYVDEMGFETIPCIYEEVSVFKNGHATVCKNGKWGIIDEYGQIVIDMQSDCPCWPSGDYAFFIYGKNGRYAITTFDAGIPSTFPYSEIALIIDHEDCFWVRDEKGWRMVSLGMRPVPFTMIVKDIKTFYYRLNDDYSELKRDEETIRICKLPMRVQNAQTGRWGCINSQLKLSIPFVDETEYISTYVGAWEVIRTNAKNGVADMEKGEFAIPCIYDTITQVDSYGLEEPLFHIANNILMMGGSSMLFGGKQGIADIQGNAIIPMIFQYIKSIEDIHGDLYQFACLQAPNMKLLDNDRLDFDMHNASIHIYDLEGKFVKSIPYFSNDNTYYNWGFKSREIQEVAEEGSAEAQYDLGYDYYYQDIEQAVKWFRKAAEQGHARAQFQLGKIYYYGKEGVKKDFDEAIKWFKLAAKQGHEEAIKYLRKHYIDY